MTAPFRVPLFCRPALSEVRRPALLGALAVVLAASGLSACQDSWLGGGKKEEPLPGKRISVLEHERRLQPAAGADVSTIRLPPPEDSGDWPQAGGYSHHSMQHMMLAEVPKERWSTNIGDGAGKRNRLLGDLVVAEGRVYGVDAAARVSAVDSKTGARLWSRDLAPSKERDNTVLGGGVAYDEGRLYVTTGYAKVYALDAKTGKVLWRQSVTGPVRAAPTVNGGRVFVVTIDDKGLALAADDGRLLWTHSSSEQAAAVLSGAAPAVDNGVVIMPYTSGEVAALRVDTGVALWSDAVVATRRTDASGKLSDIGARPVIDGNRVYVISHSGLLVALDMRTGSRVWEAELAGLSQPWVAGRYLYVLTTDNELVGLEAASGKILWVRSLPQWSNPEDKIGRIVWAGPTLVSDRLIVTSSLGRMVAVSPYSGAILGKLTVSEGITLPPAVANQSLYFLNNDADVVMYR